VSGPPLVAVVIVSHESREVLLAALASVSAHAGVPHEVVVVDNASGDGTVEAVRAAFPAASVLANAENAGFARACNQGLGASTAPLVLFLNPDAELTEGALPALVSRLEATPGAAAAGPLTRNPDGTVQVSTGPDLGLVSEWRQRRLVRGVAARRPAALAEAEALHARERDVDWVSGACLLARREDLVAVGGFDERFFLYEEDADLCRRLRARGRRVLFTPAATVRHRLGHSMARRAALSRLEYHRSHLLYYRLHNAPASQALLRLILAARGALSWAAGALRLEPAARRAGGSLVRLALRSG
jgi:GT2 family glycosyltransferase